MYEIRLIHEVSDIDVAWVQTEQEAKACVGDIVIGMIKAMEQLAPAAFGEAYDPAQVAVAETSDGYTYVLYGERLIDTIRVINHGEGSDNGEAGHGEH